MGNRFACWTVVLAGWLPALPASAYLLDASDATVVGAGELELELQPSGYILSIEDGAASQVVVPSLNAVAGLGSGWDLTLTTRGLLGVRPQTDSVGETSVAFRVLLADGAYSSGHGSDPSLALQLGVYLPEIDGEPGVAPTVALLASQMLGEVALHLHTELILTRGREREIFVSAVIQAPSSWAVQPVVEVWTDIVEGTPTASGLVGAIVPLGEDLAIEAGVRVGGWQQVEEVEGRLALFWATRWLPEPAR